VSPLSRILERYLNILVPPPSRGPNVCTTCFRPTDVSRRLNITRFRFVEARTTTSANTRQLRPDEYAVRSDVAGKRVLLIDDQWTSGASLQSSAIALKRAGTTRVVGLVIGRRIDTPAVRNIRLGRLHSLPAGLMLSTRTGCG
jgi:phosphoribosylpyrophosphate synthetase